MDVEVDVDVDVEREREGERERVEKRVEKRVDEKGGILVVFCSCFFLGWFLWRRAECSYGEEGGEGEGGRR